MADSLGKRTVRASDVQVEEFRVFVRLDKTEGKRPTVEQLVLKLADGPWHMEGVLDVEVEPIG